MRISTSLMFATLATLLVFGCAGVPGTAPSYQIVSVAPIGPLIDVRLEWTSRAAKVSSDARLSLLFDAANPCSELLRAGNIVEFTPGGQTGGIRSGERTCPAVGISDLRQWRDRRPRRRIARPGDDRAQASYRIVHDQPEYAIVRGRFPLAGRIGWAGGEDTLALIPKLPACALALQQNAVTMEFRDSGPLALYLVAQGRCPIDGFSRVIPDLLDD